MKAPIILVLIFALVAAPLFADTITLKSGQIYEGEILEKTSEYIKLKTDSEVLRIELSTIAKIEAPKGEYDIDIKARTAIHPDIVTKAEAAADAHINKMLWFGAGCLLNFGGVIAASLVKPNPPPFHLIGKSPEYVAEYTEAFQAKAKSIQTKMASLGAAVCCIYVAGAVLHGLITGDLFEDEDCMGSCTIPSDQESCTTPSGQGSK